jgi:hypothetical protein
MANNFPSSDDSLRRLHRAGWPVPAERRGAIISEVCSLFEKSDESRDARRAVAAARAALAADYQNLKKAAAPPGK